MLKVNNLSFQYEEKQTLRQLNFSIQPGEAVAIMGKSGSGKSTLIKLLYGLLDTQEGNISWKGKRILGPAYHLVPGMGFMKYVAQDFDLMPYTSIHDNIGHFLSNFNLKHKKEKIDELIELVGLTGFSTRKVSTLSGGQMQRVALAKALASFPEILLLDEPFSHLDYANKIQLSRAIFKFAKNNNTTVIFATHVPEEALQFSGRAILLDGGEIIFDGKTSAAYQNKTNYRIAQLFGEINQITPILMDKLNTKFSFFRPHDLVISKENGVKAIVIENFFTGEGYLVELLCEKQSVFVNSKKHIPIDTKVFIALK